MLRAIQRKQEFESHTAKHKVGNVLLLNKVAIYPKMQVFRHVFDLTC